MLSNSFKETIKSKITLKFKDKTLEEEYKLDRKKLSFKFRKILDPLIILFLAVGLIIYIYSENKNEVLQNAGSCKEDITYKGEGWKIYLNPLMIIISLFEILTIYLPEWMHHTRGLPSIFMGYVFLTEPFIYQYSEMLPEIVYHNIALGAFFKIQIDGGLLASSWIASSIINMLGVIYSITRLATSTIVSLHSNILIYLFLLILIPMYFYSEELRSRKQFILVVKYRQKDQEWQSFLDKIGIGIILLNEGNVFFINSYLYDLFSFHSFRRVSRKLINPTHGIEEIAEEKDPMINTHIRKRDSEKYIRTITTDILDGEKINLEDGKGGISPAINTMVNTEENIYKENYMNNTKVTIFTEEGKEAMRDQCLEMEMDKFVERVKVGYREDNEAIKNGFEEIITCHDPACQIAKKGKFIEVNSLQMKFSERNCIAIIIRDLTSKKTIEIQKTKTTKEREIYFASMSHELRNPLNALLGCLEILKRSIKDSETFEIAQSCGETLLNLIGNILDISKIENNKLTITYQIEDLKETVITVMDMLRTISDQKGINLKLVWEDLIMPTIYNFDRPRLTQILLNLISNSIKFTEKGSVHVKVEWYPIQIEINEIPHHDHVNLPAVMSPQDYYFKQLIIESDLRNNLFEERKSETSDSFQVKSIISFDAQNSRKYSKLISKDLLATSIPSTISDISLLSSSRADRYGYIKIQIIDSGIYLNIYYYIYIYILMNNIGCGIDENEIDKLFAPFIQASNSKSYGGTGLGLWIS